MKTIQMICYLKRHAYRDKLQRKNLINLFSHCCMRHQDSVLMTTYQVDDFKGVLTGFWNTINSLKYAVKTELIFMISEDDVLEEIEVALKDHFVPNKLPIKVIYVPYHGEKSEQLIEHFEKLIYCNFSGTGPADENGEQRIDASECIKKLDASGMIAHRTVRCKITPEFDLAMSVYTERLDLLSAEENDEYFLSINAL